MLIPMLGLRLNGLSRAWFGGRRSGWPSSMVMIFGPWCRDRIVSWGLLLMLVKGMIGELLVVVMSSRGNGRRVECRLTIRLKAWMVRCRSRDFEGTSTDDDSCSIKILAGLTDNNVHSSIAGDDVSSTDVVVEVDASSN